MSGVCQVLINEEEEDDDDDEFHPGVGTDPREGRGGNRPLDGC